MVGQILSHLELPDAMGSVVLYDVMSVGAKNGCNLVRIDEGGRSLWEVCPPTGDVSDFFTSVTWTGQALTATTWSGYLVTLDIRSGDVIASAFVK